MVVDGLSDLVLTVAYILFRCLCAGRAWMHIFAPLEHEPLGVHCLQGPFFPSLLSERMTRIAVYFEEPFSIC